MRSHPRSDEPRRVHACNASSCHANCGACADTTRPAWLDDPPAHALRRGATPARVRLRYVIEPDIDGEFEACSRELRKRAGPLFAVEFAVASFDDAAHAVDASILDGLRRLPQRITADAPVQPDLRVLPALPHTSFLLETMPSGDMSRHKARMDRLAARLRADENFRARRPFLLLYPSNNPIEHLGHRLISALTKGRVIVASCDPTFPPGLKSMAPLIIDAVTVPYLAHPFAVRPIGDARRPGRAPLRPVDLMYRGGTHRGMDYGTRVQMARAFRAANKSGSRVQLHVPNAYHRQMNFHLTNASSADRVEYAESGAEFARARVCAVPMGDTVTTRRLFDSMQAGCVPLVTRSVYVMREEFKRFNARMNITFRTSLPFPASIDWDRAALRFHTPLKCATTAGAQWLGQWVHRSCADSLEARRRYGAAAFDAYLDVRWNPTGVAEALLREIQETRRAA